MYKSVSEFGLEFQVAKCIYSSERNTVAKKLLCYHVEQCGEKQNCRQDFND